MKIGFIHPQTDIGRDPENSVRFAKRAEEAGFTYLQIYDHVLGADPSTRPGWDRPYDFSSNFHEPFVLYGYLAALTSLELVTGILILPQRQTALVAKQAAEVDILTKGKFRLGAGIGWNAVEYESLGIDFRTRAARCEEQIEVLRLLWTHASVDYHGRFHDIDHAGLLPMPIQSPIPIWLGGSLAPTVLDRIGRLSDGWICNTALDPDLEQALTVIREAADRAGRPTPGLQGTIRIDDFNASALRHEVEAWRTLGATHVSLHGLRSNRSLEQHLDVIAFAGEALAGELSKQES